MNSYNFDCSTASWMNNASAISDYSGTHAGEWNNAPKFRVHDFDKHLASHDAMLRDMTNSYHHVNAVPSRKQERS